MKDNNNINEAVLSVELTEYLTECYLSGIAPHQDKLEQAVSLGVDANEIRKTCEDCYESDEEEDLL